MGLSAFLPLLLLCCILFYPLAPARAMQVLTCEEPPTNYRAADGTVTGITTDIVRELLRRTGIAAEIHLMPWARAYQTALDEPDVLLYTAGRTPQREALFYWVGPVFAKRWVLFARRDYPVTIGSLDDARHVRRIAVLRRDARAQFLRQRKFTNLLAVDSHRQALQMVALGRADLWPSSVMEAPQVARTAAVDFATLKIALVLKTIYPHIIVSKKTDRRRVTQLQQAFAAMRDDGTLAAIGAAWSRKLATPIVLRDGVLFFSGPEPLSDAGP